MTAPEKLPLKRHPLADIAPYPRTTEQATAGAIIKHYVAFGEMHSHLANHFPDGDQFQKSIGAVVSSFTAVYLLTEIRSRLGIEVADEVARELWEALEDGALPPWLWDWVDEEGLDHNQIAVAADEVAANIRTKVTSAALPLGEPSSEPGQVEPAPALSDRVPVLITEVEPGTVVRSPDLNYGEPATIVEVGPPWGGFPMVHVVFRRDPDSPIRASVGLPADTLVTPYGGAE